MEMVQVLQKMSLINRRTFTFYFWKQGTKEPNKELYDMKELGPEGTGIA